MCHACHSSGPRTTDTRCSNSQAPAPQATEALRAHCAAELAAARARVHAPANGEAVDASPGSSAFRLVLADALLARLAWRDVGACKLAWAEGVVAGAPVCMGMLGLGLGFHEIRFPEPNQKELLLLSKASMVTVSAHTVMSALLACTCMRAANAQAGVVPELAPLGDAGPGATQGGIFIGAPRPLGLVPLQDILGFSV